MNKAIVAGGCFWCTEAVFQRVRGVESVTSGFCGGRIKNPPYREVLQGRTGHAEAIEIVYDEELVSYKELIDVFMATHDPTTLNRQGYDIGDHYRSAVFYRNEEQQQIAMTVIEELTASNIFGNSIVTEVAPATVFYPAEDIHGNYYNNNREQGYCQIIIDPKIKKLMSSFKQLVK